MATKKTATQKTKPKKKKQVRQRIQKVIPEVMAPNGNKKLIWVVIAVLSLLGVLALLVNTSFGKTARKNIADFVAPAKEAEKPKVEVAEEEKPALSFEEDENKSLDFEEDDDEDKDNRYVSPLNIGAFFTFVALCKAAAWYFETNPSNLFKALIAWKEKTGSKIKEHFVPKRK